MKLQDQVAPIELSKRLKELGIKQKSLFYYHPSFDKPVFGETWVTVHGTQYKKAQACNDKKGSCCAFTVAELGEMITGTIKGSTFWLRNFHGRNIQLIIGNVHHDFAGDTEAQCRALTLIHLLESKLITAEEVNNRL